MKKIISALLCVCMIITLFISCGSDNSGAQATVSGHDTEQFANNQENKEPTFTKTGSITCNEIGYSYNNAIAFRSGSKWGLADNAGNILIEPSYDALRAVSPDYCITGSNRNYRVLSRTGEEIIPLSENYIDVSGNYALIDRDIYSLETGNIIATVKTTEYIYEFLATDEHILVLSLNSSDRTRGRAELYDKSGNLLLDNVWLVINSLSPIYETWKENDVTNEKEYTFFDKEGNIFEYPKGDNDRKDPGLIQYSSDFNLEHELHIDFIVEYKTNGNVTVGTPLYGVINFHGETIIDYLYDKIEIFDNGVIAVRDNGYWGFYNHLGEKKTECIFEDIGSSFEKGYLAVEIDENWGFIDENGNHVGSALYGMKLKESGIYCFEKNGKLCVINPETGEERMYDNVGATYFPGKMFWCLKDDNTIAFSNYEKELFQVDGTEAKCTVDGKIAIVNNHNTFTFYEIT